jgi:hypothetical protein
MPDRNNGLDAQLRALARTLDSEARVTSAAEAMSRRSPSRPPRRHGVAIAAAAAASTIAGVAGAVVTLAGDLGPERVAIETSSPTSAPSSSDPGPTTTDEAASIQFDGTTFEQLPESGLAVVRGGRVLLLGFDGAELASASAPELYDLFAARPGFVIDLTLAAVATPADPAEAPDGCDAAPAGGGVRLALCGGQPQVRDRIVRVAPDGARTVVADRLPQRGSWWWAAPSPDGRWVLAQWSGECEVPTAYLIPTAGGEPEPVLAGADGLLPESSALGWTPDGRAVIGAGAGDCGNAAEAPGIYLLDPDTQETTPIALRTGDEPMPATVWVRGGPAQNDRERIVARARRELGLEGCCGEPSHGGDDVTSGIVWDGVGVAVVGRPAGASLADLVTSGTSVTLTWGEAVVSDTERGAAVSFTCGGTVWIVGGPNSDVPVDAATAVSAAEALIPHLYCTVGDPPMAESTVEPAPSGG